MSHEFIPILKFSLSYLKIIGLNPYNSSMFSKILAFISFSCIFIILLANIWVLLDWKGTESLNEVTFLPLFIMFLAKASWLLLKQDEIIKILKFITKLWPLNKMGNKIKDKNEKIINLIKKAMILFVILIHVNAFLIVLFSYPQNKLIVPGFYGCDLKDSTCLNICMGFQLITILVPVFVTAIGYIFYYVSFMTYMYIGADFIMVAFKTWDFVINDKVQPNLINDNFKDVIYQHNQLFRFFGSLRNLYAEIFLLQLWSTLGAMVFSLYMLTVKGTILKLENLATFGIFYLIILLELAMYCIPAEIISNKMFKIGDVAFEIDWHHKCQPKIRRCLSFIIQMSQKAVNLTAAKMTDINNKALVAVLKNSFSIYALLRTISEVDK